MITLRLAWRQLRSNPRFVAVFVVNLSLGLLGLIVLDAFHRSVVRSVEASSRSLLGADVAISSIDPITGEQQAKLSAAAGENAQITAQIELFSMATVRERTRLVELHGIEPAFPLVGTFEAEGVTGSPAEVVNATRGAVVDPEVVEQLGARVGDELHIGGRAFTIAGVVKSASVRSSRRFSLAPRVYLGVRHLAETGLVDTGSRVSHRRTVLLGAGRDPEAVAAALRVAFADTPVRVQSHRDAGEQLGRALTTMSDYLGLVALVALFLGALGVAYSVRAYVAERVAEIAVLITVGATVARARLWITWQIVLLSTAAAVAAWGGSALVLPWLPRLAGDYLPADVTLEVPLASLGVALVMALAGAGALSWPLLRKLGTLRPAGLFREQGMPTLDLTPRGALSYVPAALVFLALAVWQSRSFLIGGLFTGLLAATTLLAAAAAWLGLRALERRPAASLGLRLAARSLSRARVATITTFVAIALAALLASLVPQVRATLASNLERPAGTVLPSLFLFDIQEDQADGVEALLAERGLALQHKSPLIRARLASIDGAAVDGNEAGDADLDTRERDTARRFRTRAYNLSYRDGLAASEELVAGRVTAKELPAEGPAEMTLERGFAERLGVGLGSRLTFDVQGVEVEGVVVGLRAVRWASFEPNFFVQFQPAALDAAPKVFLGGVAGVPLATKEALQAQMVERFPNVSIVDVSRAVDLIEGVLDQIGWAMATMAALSLSAGLALVFAIAREQTRTRRREIGLMKVVGASFRDVRRVIDLELLLVASAAALVGVVATLGGAALVSWAVFGVRYRPDWPAAALTALAVTLATWIVARLASGAALRTAPSVLIRER